MHYGFVNLSIFLISNTLEKLTIDMKFRFFFIFILISNICFSQIKISGKIIDANNQPFEYVEVHLLSIDSTAVISKLTDDQGFFLLNIEKGDYIFQVKRFQTILFEKKISASNSVDLGLIKAADKSINLQEVVVEGRKKLVETKIDRIVYNISNDEFNKGASLIDALRRAPRLNIEQDKISIIGKNGNVRIMIDGRIQNMSEDVLKAKLKGLRADQIEKVEIIPTPPSKYSAEGNGGMINIILKKDGNEGVQGSINSGVGIQFKKNIY